MYDYLPKEVSELIERFERNQQSFVQFQRQTPHLIPRDTA
jgi:hypothetical protein